MATSIKMDDRRTFGREVLAVFEKFMQYKLPVPVDPVVDIYRRAFSDKEWYAMRFLMQEKPRAVKEDSSFSLFWTDNLSGNSECPHVTFRFPKGMSLPDFGVTMKMLPDEVERKVRVWITSVNHFRSLRKELEARIEGILGNPNSGGGWHKRTNAQLDPHVGSPGQLYRIWPELQPFFNADWKSAVRVSSVKSRLPSKLGYRMSGNFAMESWSSASMFRCEDYDTREIDKVRWNEINEVLRLMALATDIKPVPNYPNFHGPA